MGSSLLLVILIGNKSEYYAGMRTLGLRADASGFTWAVAEGSIQVPVLHASGYFKIPANFSVSAGLNHLRLGVLQLIDQYKATIAGVRTPEQLARSNESSRTRLRIEGVILAACAEKGLETIQGALSTLSSRLGVKSAKVLRDSEEYRGIDLECFPNEKREAILMGISLLKDEE